MKRYNPTSLSIGHVLDEAAGEEVLQSQSATDIDLTGTRFVDPHGLLSLLEACRSAKNNGKRLRVRMPADDSVLSYIERIGFSQHVRPFARLIRCDGKPYRVRASDSAVSMTDDTSASESRDDSVRVTDSLSPCSTGPVIDACAVAAGRTAAPARPSDVLLEVTLIENSRDVNSLVGRVKQRAQLILRKHLFYDEARIVRFIVALAELCQNIYEHSNTVGYVSIQKYRYENIRRNVVKIAVTDVGIGMKQSLSPRLASGFGGRWTDLVAMEQAFRHGISRFADPGRGHGLRCVRELVTAWDGKITIRSGRGRLAVSPAWAKPSSTDDALPYFPGTQIFMTLPAADEPQSGD
ncbi:MAG: ATP-binding protein [Planctomycetota bacterium]|nr:ATP-binding protein [Planctomycetota bacterium]